MRTEYLANESNFYQITEKDGIKYISIDGYYYSTDTDFGKGYDRLVAYSGFEMSLEDFIKQGLHKDEDRLNEMAGEVKQYIEETQFEREQGFYDGLRVKEWPLSDITLNTPCGYYVDFEELREEEMEK